MPKNNKCSCESSEFTYLFWILKDGTVVLPDEYDKEDPRFNGGRTVSVPAEIVDYLQS